MEKIRLPSAVIDLKGLAQQVILITGASSGIGQALAHAVAQQGATCILVGKNVKKLEQVYDEIMTLGGPEPAIYPINLQKAEPKHIAELVENIAGLFGRLDALVHNAGILGQISPLDHLAPQKWQEVIHLNLNIPYLFTHGLLPLLRKSPAASILFTVANEAAQGKAYWSAYSASKFGLVGLAQSLHEELENNTNIRVNCINPGKVRTGLQLHAYPGIDPMSIPAPQAIMSDYLYLLSAHGAHIRGKWIEAKAQEMALA